MDTSQIGAVIRAPIEALGIVLNAVLDNLVILLVFCGVFYLLYKFFSTDLYKRIGILFKKEPKEVKKEEANALC